MKILFATTNKAKIRYYAHKLKEYGVDILTLSDIGLSIDVEETGKTPLENAIIKAKTYAKASQYPTISLDDGLFFDTLPDMLQPNTHVRRVHGRYLNDEEMIEHYIGLVNQYGSDGKLFGYFLKGVALSYGETLLTFEKKTPRCFTNQRSPIIDEGYPLASIQMIPEFNKFKSELSDEEEMLSMDVEQKELFDFMIQSIQRL
ncbi:hypothetical protein AOC36_03315 [Erysipelothrix larvae]|uniref:Non-canonical purine NTP pyrophosphatase n=1 Tax=Erysipelothrix larvae TaxID=1514105 RepID=A0A109UGQ6_9FIRM|nr:non-canonical purine NTP pyrophosphatase [Erysipelothrix larvae]AMC93045.1 hypothetical protein AOC36_03315 [Erysipelothrix larvae]